MLLQRGIKLNEESFEEAWYVVEEADPGLFEAGEAAAFYE
jgi:hypothetical protein